MVPPKSAAVIEEIETIDVVDAAEPEPDAAEAEDEEGTESGSEFTDDDDDDDDELEFDPISQLAQLLVTEEGQPVADILVGIKDALDKHNKILFKISTLLEAKFA